MIFFLVEEASTTQFCTIGCQFGAPFAVRIESCNQAGSLSGYLQSHFLSKYRPSRSSMGQKAPSARLVRRSVWYLKTALQNSFFKVFTSIGPCFIFSVRYFVYNTSQNFLFHVSWRTSLGLRANLDDGQHPPKETWFHRLVREILFGKFFSIEASYTIFDMR